MYQLRNLVNQRNVRKDPEADFNSGEDFLLTVSRLTHSSIPYMEWRHDDHPVFYMFCAHDLDLSDRRTVITKQLLTSLVRQNGIT